MRTPTAGIGGSLVWLTKGGRATERKAQRAPNALAAPLASAPDFGSVSHSDLSTDEPPTSEQDVTTYNNFYEFGTSKSDPAENASTLRPRPWTVAIEGEINKPQVIDIDQLLKSFPLEERVYRMRCVEGWSMVIPWIGFPLGELIKRVEPTSRAKYVAFTTLLDAQQMPAQRDDVLDWPYVEGLRIDEAMHPLAILAVGLCGKAQTRMVPRCGWWCRGSTVSRALSRS